jgi:hypothetical protein
MRARYTWDVTADLDAVAPAQLPRWVLTLVTGPRRSMPGGDGAVLQLREGERNDRLFQLACALRRYGLGAQALDGALEAINRVHCVPPLEPAEVAKIAASASRYAPPARCETCGAPLPQDDERRGAVGDEDALMARALGVR